MFSKKRNPNNDVHLISNINIKHDIKSRLVTDYKRRYQVNWNDHLIINSYESPKKAAGIVSGLKQQ